MAKRLSEVFEKLIVTPTIKLVNKKKIIPKKMMIPSKKTKSEKPLSFEEKK